MPDRFGRPTDSWRIAILPFIEQTDLFNSYNHALAWDGGANLTTRESRVSNFLRPEDSSEGPRLAKFLAVVGPETPFPGARNRTFADIRDGMATTILFGEVAESDIRWAEPRDLLFAGMVFRVNGPDRRAGFGSPYDQVRVLMMDGMIRTLKDTTSAPLLRALITSDGGEGIEGEAPEWSLAAPANRE